MSDRTKAIWTGLAFILILIVALLVGAYLIDTGLEGAAVFGVPDVNYSDALALALGIVGVGFLFRLTARNAPAPIFINSNDEDYEEEYDEDE